MIPIEMENVEELKRWGLVLENLTELCAFCKKGTRFWHRKTGTPCCQDCSKINSVKKLIQANKDYAS